MMKKIVLLFMLLNASSYTMAMTDSEARHTYHNANTAIVRLNALAPKLEALEKKCTEVNILKKDLDETKNLLQETQSQMQAQNSLLLQHKKEVIAAITDFNQQAQVLMADAAKQSSMLAKLQETHKRIASSLALFETSKTTGWEAAFVQTVKKEFEL